MTKYIRKDNPSDTPVVASNNKDEILYCNKCHYKLIVIEDGYARFCTHCQSRYERNHDIRRGLVMETMDGSIIDGNVFIAGEDPSVSYAPNVEIKRKKKEFSGGIKSLSERGTINITSYVESNVKRHNNRTILSDRFSDT